MGVAVADGRAPPVTSQLIVTGGFSPTPANESDTSSIGWAVARTLILPGNKLQLYRITRDGTTGEPMISGTPKSVRVPRYNLPPDAPLQSNEVKRFPRTTVFGPPSFEFEDVELVGFRTDVRLSSAIGVKSRKRLANVLRTLNFHAGGEPEGPQDFRYSAATRTVIIELLRYGKMRTRHPRPPFVPADFMSQHELTVRILVGRVDDDTSQARDPAVFVMGEDVAVWGGGVNSSLETDCVGMGPGKDDVSAGSSSSMKPPPSLHR